MVGERGAEKVEVYAALGERRGCGYVGFGGSGGGG